MGERGRGRTGATRTFPHKHAHASRIRWTDAWQLSINGRSSPFDRGHSRTGMSRWKHHQGGSNSVSGLDGKYGDDKQYGDMVKMIV